MPTGNSLGDASRNTSTKPKPLALSKVTSNAATHRRTSTHPTNVFGLAGAVSPAFSAAWGTRLCLTFRWPGVVQRPRRGFSGR